MKAPSCLEKDSSPFSLVTPGSKYKETILFKRERDREQNRKVDYRSVVRKRESACYVRSISFVCIYFKLIHIYRYR